MYGKHDVFTVLLKTARQASATRWGERYFFREKRYNVMTFQTRYTVLFQQEIYETFNDKPPLFSNNQP
jgi:hypothetical protein